MKPLSNEQRRGPRMAVQVACALSLLGAGASLAHADGAPSGRDSGSALDRTADILRLRGTSGGGCFSPVTWGPLAPPASDVELFARLLAEGA